MAKITETQPNERTFTIEVTTTEIQQIARGLFKDTTKSGLSSCGDDNNDLYGDVAAFMSDHGVEELA